MGYHTAQCATALEIMSVAVTDIDATGRDRERSGGSAPDLAQYSLEPLRKDAEFVLYRGRYRGLGEGNPTSILVLSPADDHPSPATLRRMQEDHDLRSTLDPAHVVRSLSLDRQIARPMLILEDRGAVPLDCIPSGAMEIEEFLRFASSVTAAVGHVHSHGLVHKDIKPANMLANVARDQVWLLGFGIASRLRRERQLPNPPEVVAGTLAYMAPEQTGRVNRSIDSRSDLYALGITFYEMLTGTLPFIAQDPMELVHCHIARQPTPPHEKRAGVPTMLSRIIVKLLAKAAEERYQTAAGLQSDLTSCLTQWQSQHRIEEFPLGEQDTPDRLLIPEKLYGRESEIAELLTAFDRVVAGDRPELVLVSGYSGVGKSSVVNELHKALVPPRGLFASGKFDQYKRDIPYSTLAQAFQCLIRTLLSLSEVELGQWRSALKDALGPNGRLIVNLVPDLHLIIGEPPAIPDIPLQDAQRRFQLVMRRFIGVFARAEHPLALFLDDLQWLDSASLDLIEDLMLHSELRHLMLIGAYRDNEVDALHPLRRKLEAIRSAGAPVLEIVLAPLTASDLAGLIADSLQCEREQAAAPAALIHEKTAGNPFFAIQFISEFYEEGLLAFDYSTGKWVWDLQDIRNKGLADNVVDLLVAKLNRLPIHTEQTLELLACIGNSAELEWLGTVSHQSNEEVHRRLLDAIQADLVIHLEHSYKFTHDRVREAAYSLIPEVARAEEHLRIGRLLLAHTPAEKMEGAIFEIVNQYERGAAVIDSPEERERVADLCLLAAKRAKASSAYTSALAYLTVGATLLPEHSWHDRRELCFTLELTRAECEFLTGRPLDAQKRIVALEDRAADAIERAAIACLHIDVCTTLNQTARAVDVALEYLRKVGISCSPHPSDDDVKSEYDRIRETLGSRDTADVLNEPLLKDPEILATHDVLTRAIPPAAFIDINLAFLMICRAVNLSLERGNGDGSCFSYVMLAQMAGPRFGDHSMGFRFGQLGYDLVEQRGLRRYQACTSVAYAIYTARWVKNERYAISVIRRAFEVANSNGELNFATLCWPVITASLLFTGEPLQEAQRDAERGLALAKTAQFDFAADMIVPQLALIQMLRGAAGNFGSFDAYIDEPEFASRVCGNPGLVLAEGKYWVRKMQACFFAGDYASAAKAAEKAHLAAVTAPGAEEHAEYHYYGALAHAACCDTALTTDHSEHSDALTRHLRQLETWSSHSPDDYENRAVLVGAEVARIEGRFLDAEHLFERAIGACREKGFIQNQAIANERAASFYVCRGFETISRAYLQAAHSCYLRWGAAGKARQLRERHPWLRHEDRASDLTTTIDAPVEHLDLATVIKVSQAISGEIVLEKLLETLMRTAMEHSGADHGLLILADEMGPRIAAEAKIRDTIVVQLRDESVTAVALPESVFHSVARTQTDVILDEASSQNSFSADPYFGWRGARSVLCMPLSNRGKLIGVLYLENSLAPRVFAPGRVAVLKVLASQAAMSLENTRLYRDLAEREAKIRHLVDANIVGIEIVDLSGEILEANDAFLRIVGYDRNDLDSGRLRWTDLTATQYQDRDRQDLVAELQRSGKLHPFEWEYIRKDGGHVSVLSGAATYDGGKRAVGFVLDLTERKRVELALRQGEAYLAEAQRLTHTGSWAYNYVLGKYTYYSDEQFRIYGHDPRRGGPPDLDEVLNLFHREDRARMLDLIARVIREKCEYTVDFRIALPDGTVRYMHSIGHPVVGRDGELLEHHGTVMDVTERRRAEQRLLAQHHVTRILAESATVDEAMPKILKAVGECVGCELGTLWRIDREKEVLRCTAMWRASSTEASQFEAATWASLVERRCGLAGRVWASGTAACIGDVVGDTEFDRADIAAREGLHAAFALPILLDGDVLGIVEFLSRDVWLPDEDLLVMMTTIGSQIGQFMERKRAEDALQLAKSELAYTTRVMTMGELAASIAHEVNQPLGAMVTSAGSCSQWLAVQPPDLVKAQRALERIINDGRRAGDVIKRIRTLMKRQAPRKSSLEVNDAIREVIALTQYELRRNDILLETQFSEDLQSVQGDRVQLQQVLLNLIVNAIEAMSEMDERSRHLTVVSCMEGPDVVRIEVRDSGMGLDPEHAAHLFEPFYTTKAEGIGIGLSISRSIVEAHGGQLTAGPNAPHGAVFRLSLPVEEPVA
jgi:PAS domain S-box-containing protein